MTDQDNKPEAALESWKEIAAHLNRDVRTAKRWEKSEGLPVRRHLHQTRASVYAYPSELDAWWASRSPEPMPAPAPPPSARSRLLHGTVFACALLLALATSPTSPPAAARAAAQRTGPSLTEIFSRQLAVELQDDARMSPDGKRLAATDEGYLLVVDAQTETRKQLTHTSWDGPEFAESPVWSPDGQRIAYVWWVDDQSELRVMSADGGQPVTWLKGAGVHPSDWSPDGRHVLVSLDREDGPPALAMVASSGTVTELRALPGAALAGARFSPDGRYIAYEAAIEGRSRIFLFDVAARSEVALTPLGVVDRLPIWSTDGRSLLFISDRSGGLALWAIEVGSEKSLGEARVVFPDIGDVRHISGWDSAGRLVFMRQTSFGQLYQVAVDAASGATLGPPDRPIPQFHGKHMQAVWSPDQRHIAVLANTRGRGAVHIVSPASGARELDTRDLGWTRIAGWSPSGDAVFVSSAPGSGARAVYAVRIADGTRTVLFADPEMNWATAQVAPDASKLAVAYGREMRIIDLKTKLIVRRFTANPDEGYNGFSWAPDGGAVYAVAGRRIVRVPVPSGDVRDILAGTLPILTVSVSPDGRTIAFSQRDTRQSNDDRYQLHVVDSRGGTPKRVVLPGGHKPWRLRWAGADRIGYVSFEPESQFVRLSDFLPKE